MKIFPTDAIRRIDKYTIEHEPVSSLMLMERAAKALVSAILRDYPSSSYAVFAGSGNNGGDALAIARMLAVAGHKVSAWLINPSRRLSPDCASNSKALAAMSVGAGACPRLTFTEVNDEFHAPEIPCDTVVVDGLFGSGLNRPVDGPYAEIIRWMNSLPNDIVAVDMPSGLMSEKNPAENLGNIVRATTTYTLQFPKLSLLFAENEPFVGNFDILDISLSKEAVEQERSNRFFLEKEDVCRLLPKRPKHAHKGNFGRALLVSGSEGMAGASLLVARAALRSGVGLLTVNIPRCNNTVLQTAVPEAMTLPDICENHLAAAVDTSKYTAVAVGPGVGQHPDTERMLLALIDECRVPMVLDADALNILSRHPEYLSRLPQGSVITPHIGEFNRLVGCSENSYERLEKVVQLARELNVCVVLKGAYTVVVTPQGDCFFNSTGNPGMATGGSGDTLTGILLALLAQGIATPDAACLGVYAHGLAGDIAAGETGETALLASDIIDALPACWEKIKERYGKNS